jgi:hypothetical protein
MTEGDACQNAGPNHDAEGVCEKEKCERETPDGTVSFECLRCVPKDDVVDCQAFPVCPDGMEQVKDCPDSPDVECAKITMCSNTILCASKGDAGVGGGDPGGAVDCQAMPVCPEGMVEVERCPERDDVECAKVSMCDNTILCAREGGAGGAGGQDGHVGSTPGDQGGDDDLGTEGQGGAAASQDGDDRGTEDGSDDELDDSASGGGGSGGAMAVNSAPPEASATDATDTAAPAPTLSCAVQVPQGSRLVGFGGPLAMIAAGVLSLRVASRRKRD